MRVYSICVNIIVLFQISMWITAFFNLIHTWNINRTRQIWGIWKLRPAYSPETPNFGQNRWCFVPCDLEFWWMTLKNNRAPFLCCFQLCAWFHCHMWIQTGVRVRKRLSWVLTSVTLTFDLWPWPFAWISLLTMVITPENFMMIRWWEHGEKGVTDRRTDGQTEPVI